MDKIFLKPTAHEINIKGNSKEGHTDVFAYDYHDDDSRRKLGGLYIVGNVKQDENVPDEENAPDIAYVTNLVASLAKREYYSKPDSSPRDAFSATLKKINDVVEEFFKNKSLKVNIGIFAIAGEDIMISKLGKFKIILGRPARAGGDSRAVDILNNVDLFDKEQIEEKEFSNVISGKVMAGDKLFAFYPNRMITAREKAIKADLLKVDAGFIEKINSIKETRPDFDCGALYLSLERHKESAFKKPKAAVPVDPPLEKSVSINLAKMDIKELKPATEKNEEKEDVPNIRSSEFSLGKKSNPLLASIMTPVNILRGLYSRNINIKRKFILLSLIAGMLITGVVLVKTFVVIDPEKRQLNALINQAQNDLKLARTKINQNDLIGARELLVNSLSNIYTTGITNDRTQKTTSEVYEVLDNMDKAVEVSPSLLETMSEELNKKIAILDANKEHGLALDIYENNLYILTDDNILKIADIDNSKNAEPSTWLKSGGLPAGQAGLPPQPTALAVDGNIYVMNVSGNISVYYKGEKVSDTNTFVVSGPGDVLLTTKDSDKIYLVNKTLTRIYEFDKKTLSLTRTLKVGSSEPFVDAYLVDDSTIIIVTKDGRIWEVK